MGKRKPTQNPTTSKPSTPLRAEQTENPPAAEIPSVTQQPQQTPPIVQPETMISIAALAEFLQRSNHTVDWGTTLSVLSQVGSLTSPAAAIPPTSTPPTPISTTENLRPIPTTEITPPTVPFTKETPPTVHSQPSPVHPQNKPLDVSPLSAYQDPGSNEESANKEDIPEEKGDGEEKGEIETGGAEETSVPESTSGKLGEVDLNETAREQCIMTDEEFQSVLDQVSREEEDAEGMAEGLDLASQAGGSENPGEPMVEHMDVPSQSVGEEDSDKQAVPETEVSVIDSEVAKPTGPKTKDIRRKLVLKDDPKAKRPKPSRVSQRCLWRWAAKRAGSNTAFEAVVISSEEEGEVPANSGEKTPPAPHEEPK